MLFVFLLIMEKYKTVIIGAGPAGLRCAKILAENNEDFILLERKSVFDRKICTGMWGISDKTAYMEIPDHLFDKKFKQVKISTPHHNVIVKNETPFVATVNRKKLSEWMYNQAKEKGANIRMNAPVSEICKNYVVVKGKKIFFENLVGADGSASIVRQSLNLDKHIGIGIQFWIENKGGHDMEVHFDADFFGPWYSWVAPYQKKVCIGTGADPRVIPVPKLKENLKKWCAQRGYKFNEKTFEGSPINYDYKGYKFENKYLIGDAAGFPSGLTGEGIFFGMCSGEDVAKLIINPNHNPKLIKNIIKIKKEHELIEKTFQLNKTLDKIEYETLVKLLKLKFFDKMVINLVA